MKIFVGADHRGFPLKRQVVAWLTDWGHEVVDMGTHVEGEICDYPQISHDVGLAVVAQSRQPGDPFMHDRPRAFHCC